MNIRGVRRFYHILPLFCSHDFEMKRVEMITHAIIQYSREIAYSIIYNIYKVVLKN